MIKKIIIFVLIALAVIIFYKRFMADILEPFFGKHANNVDFYQLNSQEPEVKE